MEDRRTPAQTRIEPSTGVVRTDATGSGRRAPLTRARVLEAAVELADDQGIEAVSMRKLGQRLGVEAMSLYNHVANKDDVLLGMIDIVLDQIEIPDGKPDWKESIRRTALSSHAAFMRHRWACNLAVGSGGGPRPHQLTWMEAVLQTFREAGFSAHLTHHAYHAVDSHITGYTLWLVRMPFKTHDELVALAERVLPTIPADQYPYFFEHAQQHLQPPDPTDKPEFEFGLELILDGLERLLEAESGAVLEDLSP